MSLLKQFYAVFNFKEAQSVNHDPYEDGRRVTDLRDAKVAVVSAENAEHAKQVVTQECKPTTHVVVVTPADFEVEQETPADAPQPFGTKLGDRKSGELGDSAVATTPTDADKPTDDSRVSDGPTSEANVAPEGVPEKADTSESTTADDDGTKPSVTGAEVETKSGDEPAVTTALAPFDGEKSETDA